MAVGIVPALFERTMEINPAELAQAAYLAAAETDVQKLIVKARDYHAGESFDTELQTKLDQFVIGGDVDDIKGLNISRKVVNSVLRRLSVQSFDISGLGEDETAKTASDKQAAWAGLIWKDNRMDTKQRRVHRQALVDAESFVIVSYDSAEKRPLLSPHQRYTDATVDGDGYGCKGHYPNDDISQPMEYASKRWTETYYEGATKKTRRRMTLYYPNAVYKYVHSGVDWSAFQDEGETTWPLPWVDDTNQSLGIPAIHFINPEERPEAMDAFGVQVATDQVLVDLIGAAALTAFRIFWANFQPTTDGEAPEDDDSNRLKLQPGVIIGIPDEPDAKLEAIESADLSQLMALIDKLFVWCAIITETPVSEFSASGQIAAEGTLKQQESALLARAEERQDVFGDAWEDVIKMARRLDNFFGSAGQDESLTIETIWKEAATRNQKEVREDIKAKAETGVPWQQLMVEWGYAPDKIAEMEKMADRVASLDAMALFGADQEGD